MDLAAILESILRQAGFAALLVAVGVYFGWRVVLWGRIQIEKLIEEARQRELAYRVIIDRQTEALNKHTEQAQSFHNEVKTAHEYQRAEHAAQNEEHKKIGIILDGVQQAVGQINGYVKEEPK